METNLTKISIEKVKKLYTVLTVQEYYTSSVKCTNILPDGQKVFDATLYSAKTLQEEQELIESVVQKCVDAGASIVQFKCTDEQGHRCYVDYKVHELMPAGTLLTNNI